MKKQFKHITIALCLALLGTSCNNFLDVRPEGEVLGKDLLTERKGFENALYGAYATMRDQNLYGRYAGYYVLDVMAQYFNCQGNTNITDLSTFNYYKNPDVKKVFFDMWCNAYRNISYINNVLINLEHESSESLKFYDIYKGEALGLRAYLHFDLLRLYASQQTQADTRGIVYSTGFSVSPSEVLTKEKTLHRIIAELREAERLLDNPGLYEEATENDAYLRDRQTHFNLQAARATLARVYLTTGKTDSAYYYADKVISESGLQLVDKTEIKNDIIGTLSAKETIFGIYSKDFYTNTKADLYNSTSFSSLDPRSDIHTAYETTNGNDYRWSAWFQEVNNQRRFVKLTDVYQLNNIGSRPQGQIPGINLLRLPEMYYIAAECLLKKDIDKATGYFNDVLESRGLTPLDQRVPAETLTLEKITEERYKEFVGEGQTFFNMKRLNLDIKAVSGETVPASEAIYTIDIPEEEFNYRN